MVRYQERTEVGQQHTSVQTIFEGEKLEVPRSSEFMNSFLLFLFFAFSKRQQFCPESHLSESAREATVSKRHLDTNATVYGVEIANQSRDTVLGTRTQEGGTIRASAEGGPCRSARPLQTLGTN
jgi:hypothetical protein